MAAVTICRSQLLPKLGNTGAQLPGALWVWGPCCAGLDFTREGKRGSSGALGAGPAPTGVQWTQWTHVPGCQLRPLADLSTPPRRREARPAPLQAQLRACALSGVQPFAILWPAARHCGPLSLGFPGQEYRSGLPFPSPGDLPDRGLNPCLLHWQADITRPSGKPWVQLLEVARGQGAHWADQQDPCRGLTFAFDRPARWGHFPFTWEKHWAESKHSTKCLVSTPEEWDGYQKQGQPEKLSLSRGAYGDFTTKFNVGWDPGTEKLFGKN